ncbi:peptidoglycan-binding protein [Phaeovulum sp.]|uniref:peptidoglycan-binding domain-containing protein n=1 Tax=Phaeovulum sp. TaxID=2934796 RepID=UPI0035658137
MPRAFAIALSVLSLASCAPTVPLPATEVAATLTGEVRLQAPSAAQGACWASQVRPAVIETVTEQVLIRAEQRDPATGTVIRPAAFRTETRQEIVSERTPIWFRTPCADALTPDFVAALQRALRVRGYFHGFVNGEFDSATARAISAYQTPRGLPSSTLALATARELGLIAVELDR